MQVFDRLIQALADRISRQLEPRLDAFRDAAGEVVEDLDDRIRLLRIELRSETGRMARMVLYAAAAVVFAIGSLLWLCAGVILLAWSTDYRTHAIVAVIAVWLLATAFSIGMTRALALRGRHAFRLSRALFAADAAVAREFLRERGQDQ